MKNKTIIKAVFRVLLQSFPKNLFLCKIEKKDREDRVMNHFKGKQLKKSKYFYLDKKSNFWGAHHSSAFSVSTEIKVLMGITS
ncbi:hypothetical protein V6S65_10770 [Lactococcus lactis]|uniref:hypothetical protein n=1 Tax=Lactococcus lactis TaxID=1358 RepID=UPI002FE433DC